MNRVNLDKIRPGNAAANALVTYDSATKSFVTTYPVSLTPAAASVPLAGGGGTIADDWLSTTIPRTTQWQKAFLSSDQSITSSTTLTGITGMSFAIGSAEQWWFRGVFAAGDGLTDGAGGGGGVQFAMTVPAGCTVAWTITLVGDTNTTTNPGIPSTQAAFKTATSAVKFDDGGSTAWTPPNARCIVYWEVWISNGATAGSFVPQYAQAVSSATATKLKKGGTFIGQKLN